MGVFSFMARQYAKFYSPELFIGVTGSIGKTVCVQACEAILRKKYKTLTTKLNASPHSALPQALLNLNPSIKKVILEMGIHKKGEIDSYLRLIKPQTVIVTKIAYAHSDHLGGLEEIIEEEQKLIAGIGEKGVAILNFDDPASKKLVKEGQGQVVFFGTDPDNCLVWAGNILIENFRTTFELNYGVERVRVNFKLLGMQYVYSALAAAALGILNQIPLTRIKIALEELEPVEHQMEPFYGPNGSVILDDTHAFSPADVEASIDTLLQISARRRILVLGELRDLGSFSEEIHRHLAQKIYKEKIDLCFLGQGDTIFIADELKRLGFWEEKVETNLQNSQIVSKLLKTLGKGDVVLVKGQHAVRLDEVVKRIAKKKEEKV